MKTAEGILDKMTISKKGLVSDEIYCPFDDALKAMELYRLQTIKECQEVLLKQMHDMSHNNGYPSKAVPHAVVLSLPSLMNGKTE